MPSREDIVSEARTWIGTPWRHQGRTKQGIDCAGLVVKVAHTLQFTDFDILDYARNTRGMEFMRYFGEHMDEIPIVQVQEGDVILFRDSKFPCHSAIVSSKQGEKHIIHAYARRKQVIEEPLTEDWRSLWVAAFRFRGVS